MGTYTQILYQVVFRTKGSKPTLLRSYREALFSYMAGVLIKKNCVVYQIGGVEDHVHLVFRLHPSVALADLVKDLKLASSKMMHSSSQFPEFESWASGNSAFTYAEAARENLINYVMHQEQHHTKLTFETELRKLLEEHHVEVDARYFLKD